MPDKYNQRNRIVRDDGTVRRSDETELNWADISLARIRAGSVVGSLQVSTTATPVFVNTDELNGRHELHVFNDASAFIYWSFNSTPTIGSDTMPIPSGGMVRFKYDPNDPQQVYLITSGLTTTVKVVEIK